jgi:hypothetical protein
MSTAAQPAGAPAPENSAYWPTIRFSDGTMLQIDARLLERFPKLREAVIQRSPAAFQQYVMPFITADHIQGEQFATFEKVSAALGELAWYGALGAVTEVQSIELGATSGLIPLIHRIKDWYDEKVASKGCFYRQFQRRIDTLNKEWTDWVAIMDQLQAGAIPDAPVDAKHPATIIQAIEDGSVSPICVCNVRQLNYIHRYLVGFEKFVIQKRVSVVEELRVGAISILDIAQDVGQLVQTISALVEKGKLSPERGLAILARRTRGQSKCRAVELARL